MKVGVTGGAGFIGGHVVDRLRDHGHDVMVFDHLGRGMDVMLGDTRDDTAVTELAAHVDGIIHLASVLGTQETVFNPRPAVETNIRSGLNVFEAACQYNLPVVNIAVGNHGMANPYSASKTCVETLGHMYRADRGLAINQVRAVNAYGPRQAVAAPFGPAKVRKIMPSFICRALSGMPIEIYGDGRQISDCVHVTDVAHALVAALEYAHNGDVIPEVIEVGPTRSHSVLDVALMVRDACAQITGQPVDIVHLPMRPGEKSGGRVVADTSTLKHINIDPDAFIPLDLGIPHAVDWFANNEGLTWSKPGTA